MSIWTGKMLGSFTEELVNRTIDWYSENRVALFRKSHVPIAFGGSGRDPIDKGDVDYYGVYRGMYISFEVKETSRDFFPLSQLKEHQRRILLDLHECGAVSFLLLNFTSRDNTIFLIGADRLILLLEENRKKITFEEAKSLGTVAPIAFPGVVDWLLHLGLKK